MASTLLQEGTIGYLANIGYLVDMERSALLRLFGANLTFLSMLSACGEQAWADYQQKTGSIIWARYNLFFFYKKNKGK